MSERRRFMKAVQSGGNVPPMGSELLHILKSGDWTSDDFQDTGLLLLGDVYTEWIMMTYVDYKSTYSQSSVLWSLWRNGNEQGLQVHSMPNTWGYSLRWKQGSTVASEWNGGWTGSVWASTAHPQQAYCSALKRDGNTISTMMSSSGEWYKLYNKENNLPTNSDAILTIGDAYSTSGTRESRIPSVGGTAEIILLNGVDHDDDVRAFLEKYGY